MSLFAETCHTTYETFDMAGSYFTPKTTKKWTSIFCIKKKAFACGKRKIIMYKNKQTIQLNSDRLVLPNLSSHSINIGRYYLFLVKNIEISTSCFYSA